MRFVVPAAPWLAAGGPHPLAPGDYTIGVTCIGTPPIGIKAPGFVPCDRRPAEAAATFQLLGPESPCCQTPCTRLTLSPDHGPPGTEVQVGGWAPLNDFIGDKPSVYQVVIEPPAARTDAPIQIGYARQDVAGTLRGTARLPAEVGWGRPLTPGRCTLALETLIPGNTNGAVPPPSAEVRMTPLGSDPASDFQVLLAPTTFAAAAAPSWGGLGPIHPIEIQPDVLLGAGIAGDPTNPRHLAYCGPNGIRVSDDGGGSWSTIPTIGAVPAAAGSPYGFSSQPNQPPRCSYLAVDPAHSGRFYAAFDLIREEDHSAPPMYDVRDRLRHHRRRPHLAPDSPAKRARPLDLRRLPGRRSRGARAVLRADPRPAAPELPRPGHVRRGKDLDRRPSPLPRDRPVRPLGAAYLILTGMGATFTQAIERSTDGGRTWPPPSWPSTVPTRYGSCQLVALGPASVALVGSGLAGPGYAFLLSDDRGATWGDRLWWLDPRDAPGSVPPTIESAPISALHCGSR